MTIDDSDEATPAQAFGAWLLAQRGAGGFVGGLANAAATGRAFPKQGNVAEVSAWLQEQRPSGDDWEALEDAEAAWLRG